jgi:prevent-host-death family protein
MVGIAQAKARFAEMVNHLTTPGAVPVVITRRGVPVAVLRAATPQDAVLGAAFSVHYATQEPPAAAPTPEGSPAPPIAPPAAQNQAGRPGLTLADITRASR